MVTINQKVITSGIEISVYCLSTDTKPTQVTFPRGNWSGITADFPNGSQLTEIDTGNFYLFDGGSKTWVFQCSLQG